MPCFPGVRQAGLALSICLMAATQAAHAAWPEKPIRFIVPAAPGGGADTTSRIITTALAQRLGQAFIIDNRPGAAGAIGLDAIAKASPDGYTIGTANMSNFTVASNVAKSLPYSPARDFAPIAMLFTQPYLLGVTSTLPVKSVKELVAYGKANPKGLFSDMASDPLPMSVAEFAHYLQSEDARWSEVIRKGNITAD